LSGSIIKMEIIDTRSVSSF